MGKADLGKGYWIVKRKLGVTMHFSEIIKLQFGKKIAIHCFVFCCFFELSLLIFKKIYMVTPNFRFAFQ